MFKRAITRNGSPLGNVISAEATCSNGLDRIETIRSDGRIEGADPGMAAPTGRVEVRFADSTLITPAIDGTPCGRQVAYPGLVQQAIGRAWSSDPERIAVRR